MSNEFSRSTRSLAEDGFRRSTLLVLLVAALLAGWAVWFFCASVAIYGTTDRARLEVIEAVHPVAAAQTGRVVSSRLALGLEVQKGDVLVELDSEPERLRMAEEHAREQSAKHQVEVLRRQLAAAEQAQNEDRQSAQVALEAAAARKREGEAGARHADEKLKRMTRLNTGGVAGEQELLDAQMEAQKAQAAAEALSLAVSQRDWELKTRESDRRAELEELRSEIARIEGEMAASAAAVNRLQHEIERRRILAPVAGRLGEVEELRIGAMVAEGAKLATVVPGGQLILVAEFEPAAVVGRIRPGQSAWLHLHGFPSIQYGTVPATVKQTGSETRNARVRVELDIHPDRSSRIPFQHGLPGTVEVEVERLSPATLVLRAAGQLLNPAEDPSSSVKAAEAAP